MAEIKIALVSSWHVSNFKLQIIIVYHITASISYIDIDMSNNYFDEFCDFCPKKG